MTPMPESLVRVRDEQAVESMRAYNLRVTEVGNMNVFEPHFSGYCSGFDACYSALADAAGEFDEKAVRLYFWQQMTAQKDAKDKIECQVNAARWQHSQDAARIALAELLAKNSEAVHLEWAKQKERIADLEELLKKSNDIIGRILSYIKNGRSDD